MIRKTAAILLLMLLVFNTVGYKLWFTVAMEKADSKLEAALDKHSYNREELFTLKIPLNLPYQNITSSFERINGEITVNGETYTYVQRKVEKDTMVLECIRNTEKTSLQQRSNDYFGKVNDVAGNDAKKNPGKDHALSKFSLSDFTNDITLWKYRLFKDDHFVYLSLPCNNNTSEHLQKLIKPPQSV